MCKTDDKNVCITVTCRIMEHNDPGIVADILFPCTNTYSKYTLDNEKSIQT
jgi:hypothetical protein